MQIERFSYESKFSGGGKLRRYNAYLWENKCKKKQNMKLKNDCWGKKGIIACKKHMDLYNLKILAFFQQPQAYHFHTVFLLCLFLKYILTYPTVSLINWVSPNLECITCHLPFDPKGYYEETVPDVQYHVCSYTASLGVSQMLCTKPLKSYKRNCHRSIYQLQSRYRTYFNGWNKVCDNIQTVITLLFLSYSEKTVYTFSKTSTYTYFGLCDYNRIDLTKSLHFLKATLIAYLFFTGR